MPSDAVEWFLHWTDPRFPIQGTKGASIVENCRSAFSTCSHCDSQRNNQQNAEGGTSVHCIRSGTTGGRGLRLADLHVSANVQSASVIAMGLCFVCCSPPEWPPFGFLGTQGRGSRIGALTTIRWSDVIGNNVGCQVQEKGNVQRRLCFGVGVRRILQRLLQTSKTAPLGFVLSSPRHPLHAISCRQVRNWWYSVVRTAGLADRHSHPHCAHLWTPHYITVCPPVPLTHLGSSTVSAR